MTALHYLETMVLAPDGKRGNWRDRYWGEFCGTLVPLMQGWGFSLAGAWQTPIGAGHGNEFSVLWSVDGESAWAEHVRRMVGPTRDPGLRAWRSAASDYVEHSAGRLLVASPGHDLTVLGRRAAGERVEVMPAARPWLYEVEFTQFAPEGRDGHWREDYWPEFRERLFPTLGRLGLDLVGAWETAPGSGQADECVFLYRTRDFGTWQQFIDASAGSTRDPVLRARRAEMWVWRERWYTKLMVPAAGHEVSLLRRELE